MSKKHFQKGAIIFREGDPSNYAYIIDAGRVEVRKHMPGSERSIRIATPGKGEVFGEMGIVSEKPRSATVTALDDVDVTEISYDEFLNIMMNKPKEGIKYLRFLFERLREASSYIDVQKIVEESTQNPNLKGKNIALTENAKKRLRLVPLSDRATAKIGVDGKIITQFPYRVGRLSSSDRENPLGINQLYLSDSKPYTVSRNHFSLELIEGMFIIRDRGSHLGLLINDDIMIGGGCTKNTFLIKSEKTKFVVGNRNSEEIYRFGIIIEDDTGILAT